MPRLNRVGRNKKEGRICRVCNKPIKVGDPYNYMEPRFKGRINAHVGCRITPAMYSSSKMVAVWEAQDVVSKATTVADISQALHDLADTAREVGEEYRDSAERQREYFPDSSVADDNEQKADDLDGWADELESTADEVDSLADVESDLEREEDESDEDFSIRLGNAEDDAKSEALDEAESLAGIANECPVD